LAWRRAHRKHLGAALWSTLTWPWHALIAPTLVHNPAKPLVGTAPRPESFTKPVTMSHQFHTYPELRQQFHDDLRIQHPEWIEPNGESSMRLLELVDVSTRRGFGSPYHRRPNGSASEIRSAPQGQEQRSVSGEDKS
jgi:hypothetical protein